MSFLYMSYVSEIFVHFHICSARCACHKSAGLRSLHVTSNACAEQVHMYGAHQLQPSVKLYDWYAKDAWLPVLSTYIHCW